ncbi:hypothetical protein [Coleofasciculus sp.]|uniref:hypothetical protein n=1 Tax=Coleofasciculus sp. TaxID=3100458 RepID=UPI003A38DEBF
MENLMTRAIAHISSLLQGLQVKRFLAVVLVPFLLLTTNVDSGRNNQALSEQVRDEAQQIDSVRPKTTKEWYEEARETENSPGERLQKIGEESAQAVKEFGSIYPETVKQITPDLQDNTAQAGK